MKKSGLHYCGFIVSPTGMLRDIGIEARRVADEIARLEAITTDNAATASYRA